MNVGETMYLDHAAATPVDPLVVEVMQPFFTEFFYNPSSPYAPAVMARRVLEEARHSIAKHIGAGKDDVIFTAGATESIQLAMTAASGKHVVTTAIEHPAVLESVRQYSHAIVGVSPEGMVLIEALERAITDETIVVSIALANNELGTIQPLSQVAELLTSVRKARQKNGNATPLWLHADASQGVGQIAVNVARLGVDMLTLNSGKMYGPKQVGILWRKPGVKLTPVVYGGGQEMGLRSGTENVAGAVGMAKALELAESRRKQEFVRLAALRNSLETALVEVFGERCMVLGSRKKRLAGHLSVSFPGLDAERLVYILEQKGVLVSTGSACAANKATGSHVLAAIGLSEAEMQGSLRMTFGHLNSEQNTKKATQIIIEAIRHEMQRTGIA